MFPNQFTGQYLTVSTLEQVIRRSAAAAGLSGVTPHCLRHSFATHLMEQGVEQRNIQALLGHRDPTSTEVIFMSAINPLWVSAVLLTERLAKTMDKPVIQIHYYILNPVIYSNQKPQFPAMSKLLFRLHHHRL